jgi:death-on-curing protein
VIRYVTLGDARLYLDRNRMYARDYGLIDSALHRPKAVVFGAESYPGFHEKAAALFDALLRSHPVIDGNKRLAWALTMLFYRLNGRRVVAEFEEALVFVRVAADRHVEMEILTHWFATHAGETPEVDEDFAETLSWFQDDLHAMAKTIAEEDAERARHEREVEEYNRRLYEQMVAENDRHDRQD